MFVDFLLLLNIWLRSFDPVLGATLTSSYFGKELFNFDWTEIEVISSAKTLRSCANECTEDEDLCPSFAFEMNSGRCSRGHLSKYPMNSVREEREIIIFDKQKPVEDGQKKAIALMSMWPKVYHNDSGTLLDKPWIPPLAGDICAAFTFKYGIMVVLRTGETMHIKFGSRIWKTLGNTVHGPRALTGFIEILGQYWLIGGNIAAPPAGAHVDKETTEYFDGKTWRNGFTLPYKVREVKVVKVSGTEGFLFGGSTNNAHNWNTYMIDFEAWSLTQKTNISIGTTIHCAGSYTLDGKVYVVSVGGYNMYGAQTTELQIYDVALDSWSRGADSPRAPTGSVFLPYDGGLVLFDHQGALKYEYTTDQWVNNWPDGVYTGDFGYLNIPIIYDA